MNNKTALYEEVLSCANIISGDEYKKLFCTIAKVVSDTVAQTLGPYGTTTIIDDGSGFTYPTKDGWSCMNRLRFNDPIYNTIFGIIKQVSFNSVSTVGDGTTTAMVATSAFLDDLYDDLIPTLEKSGQYRQATLVDTMNAVCKELTETLLKSDNVHHINPDGDFEDIYKVAYIATNGNEAFSKMIQEIYQKTKNPNIRIEIDNGAPETTYTIEKGYRFDCKPIAFNSYINDETGVIRKDDKPFKIITFDHNVTYQMHKNIVTSISRLASATNTEYVLLAPYFDDIICSIIQNSADQMRRQGQIPNIMLVQIPTALNMHQLAINDISVLGNSIVFTETLAKVFNTMFHNATCEKEEDIIKDSVLELPQFAKYSGPQAILEDVSGTIKSAVFEQTEGFIQDYEEYCDKARYEALIREVKELYEKKKAKAIKTINGLLDKDFLFTQLRYTKLIGNSGIIKVGGISDIQKRCDKDSLDDAALACRSAFENGYVRGMCLEIISACKNATKSYDETDIDSVYKHQIYMTILNAFSAVFNTVIYNKIGYSDHSKTAAAVIQSRCLETNSCFNLRTETFDGPNEWTVINSVQTDIEILTAMSSILTTIMTSSQFLTMNRSCDMKVTHDKALEQRIADEAAIAAGRAKAVVEAIETTDWKNGVSLGIYPVNTLASEEDNVDPFLANVDPAIVKVTPNCNDTDFYQKADIDPSITPV